MATGGALIFVFQPAVERRQRSPWAIYVRAEPILPAISGLPFRAGMRGVPGSDGSVSREPFVFPQSLFCPPHRGCLFRRAGLRGSDGKGAREKSAEGRPG
ncbi:MAG: hypothetical protein AAGU11_13855, partial [Syntrophobacteraceae bacterium]